MLKLKFAMFLVIMILVLGGCNPSTTQVKPLITEKTTTTPLQTSASPPPSTTTVVTTVPLIPTPAQTTTPTATLSTPTTTTAPVPTTTPTQTTSSTPTLSTPTTTAAPMPTTTPTVTPSPPPAAQAGKYDGLWRSKEQNTGAVSGDVIEFVVKDNKFVTLEISWFPEPGKWFYFNLPEDKPIAISSSGGLGLGSSSSPTEKGQGQFTITGQFVSQEEFRGTMKMPKGFYWVLYGYTRESYFDFTVVRIK